MPIVQNNHNKIVTSKHTLFAIVVVIIVSTVVWYFKSQIPFVNQMLSTPQPINFSESDKYKILENLAKENTAVTTEESKLKTLGTLEKQKVSSAMSESDKFKLLESLK